MDSDLKRITARNISYNAVATVLVAAIQFFTNIILARVLSASDYGIVGFANIFVAFMMQFGDFGLNNALVQRKDLDTATLSTAFTLKALFSVLIFLGLLAGAPLARLLMDRPEIVAVIRLLSLNFLLSVGSFLPQVLMTRELDYRKLAMPSVVSVAAGSALAIGLAHAGFGYWSIAANSVFSAFLSTLILLLLRPATVSFRYDRSAAGSLLRFGGSVLVPGIMVFFIFNTDNFAIGALRGAEQLGYYAIAFNWGSMICVQLATLFHKVLFPTFARLQHDLHAISKAYLSSVRYVAFLAVPVNIILLLYGKEFLIQVLGRGSDRWLPSLPALQILCIYGIFRVILEPVGNVILAIGKPELCIRSIMFVAVIELGLLYPAVVSFGVPGVAVCVTVAYLSQYFVYLPLIHRELGIKGRDLMKEIRISLAATAVMAGILAAAKSHLPSSLPVLLGQGGAAAVLYLGVYALMDRGALFGELKALLLRRGTVTAP